MPPGPMIFTPTLPSPAPSVYTLKSTVSLTLIPRMTRVFLEIVELFIVKMLKKLWKLSKLSKKVKIYAINYIFFFLDFY